MRGLLLAGGYGTRLRPLTSTGNKHMLPIANKPMLVYGLEHLKNAGIKEICIIQGPIKEGIMETLGDGSKYGVHITYVNQPEPKGLAHAVQIAENFLHGEPFVMYLGDNLLRQGVAPLVEEYERNNYDCLVGTIQVKNPSQFGVVVFDKKGELTRFVEKPKELISDWALIGVYIFNDKVFDALKKIKPSWRGELEITDTLQTLLTDGARVGVQKVQGWWKDTGKPEDLLEANQLILGEIESFNKGTVSESAILTGNVQVGDNSVINGRSTIRGPVVIGEHCEIGPNCYIGPYTSIGDHCKVANAEIENCIIMAGVRIDCSQRIIDSLIGKNVEITDARQNVPKGHKLILGDASKVTL
jgi:glucose-1-phosphate thymidylyltransferase